MFGKKKVHQYNSKNYDLTNANDFMEFYDLIDTLKDFDFAVKKIVIDYMMDITKANIYVETSETIMEIWLRKKGFEEA